jgi:hypothetical protein
MPSSLFEHHDDVPVGRDGGSELGQKHVHGRGRDMRDDERESVSRGGSHRVLEIGRGEALVAEAKGALAAHQSMADASVAPHLCLVLEPKLEFGTGIGGTSALYSRDEPLLQTPLPPRRRAWDARAAPSAATGRGGAPRATWTSDTLFLQNRTWMLRQRSGSVQLVGLPILESGSCRTCATRDACFVEA